jgi:hypothetical protein
VPATSSRIEKPARDRNEIWRQLGFDLPVKDRTELTEAARELGYSSRDELMRELTTRFLHNWRRAKRTQQLV